MEISENKLSGIEYMYISQNIDGEIIVVDNNSVDGSNQLINEKFSDIQLIANTKNTGFAVANNQAIKFARVSFRR